MRKLMFTLLITFCFVCATPAEAQIFFNRKPKTPPAQRVQELIIQAKTDADDRKRAAAAGELHDFDGKAYPEVVAVLVDLARNDSKANVRLEALSSLAKIRPVSQSAGQTLEWAAAHDDTWKNRMQAKTSLLRYQWAGYHADKNDAAAAKSPPPGAGSPEPPLATSREMKGARTPAKVVTTPNAPPIVNAPIANVPRSIKQPQPQLPVIVNQPAPTVVAQPPANFVPTPTPTPPPIIVSVPSPQAIVPVPTPIAPPPVVVPPSPPKINLPPVPETIIDVTPKFVLPPIPGAVIETTPKTPLPAVPVVAPRTGATEPNFRPAGQTPPRPVFTTATPQTQTVVQPPAPKNTETGPTLTPPM